MINKIMWCCWGARRGQLETAKPHKKRRKPQNRNEFRPKPKIEIKSLTDKASVASESHCCLIFLRLNLIYFPKFFLRIPSPLVTTELVSV